MRAYIYKLINQIHKLITKIHKLIMAINAHQHLVPIFHTVLWGMSIYACSWDWGVIIIKYIQP